MCLTRKFDSIEKGYKFLEVISRIKIVDNIGKWK